MKKNAITCVITLMAAGSIFAVSKYNGIQMAQLQESASKPQAELVIAEQTDNAEQLLKPQQVSIQTISAGSYSAEVVGYGEAKARYDLRFTSEVTGRVEFLAEAFETGKVVSKGDVIAKLDNSAYLQAVAQAKADVAAARLALLEEQRQGEQARSEWDRSGLGGEPNSPLVLREPQLASAKATLTNAKQTLLKAEKDLADTVILAPFDALVISRDIQPGSYLSVGSDIATFYSVDQVEVEIPLSDQQWANLTKTGEISRWKVLMSDTSGQYQWQARVERSYQHVTQETRQRSLIVVVDNPLKQQFPLYPGTFVQATLTGVENHNLWEIPASALSQHGDIWTVDEQGKLQKAQANKQFERQDRIYVAATQSQESVQIVMRPLSNFTVGMKVMPEEEG